MLRRETLRMLLLAVAAVTMLMVALTASAAAGDWVMHDECRAIGNPTEIVEFDVDTESHVPGAESRFDGSGLICGTAVKAGFGECEGKQTLYEKFVIDLPPGAKFTSTEDVTPGSFVGSAIGDALQVLPGCKRFNVDPVISEDGRSTIETRILGAGDCPGHANEVACFYGFGKDDDTGITIAEQYTWVEESGGRQTMTLGEVKALGGILDDIGFIKFDLDMCERYGAPNQPFGSEQCGNDSAEALFTNGDSSSPRGCVTDSGPQGLFTMVGTMRRGDVTPPATDCVYWAEPLVPIRSVALLQ